MANKYLGTILRILATAVVLVVAAIAGWLAWQHYVYAPWTRDARVQADIINIASEVAGTVTRVAVTDDSYVHAGDLLFAIDSVRFRYALASAKAALDQARAQSTYDSHEARRLRSLPAGGVAEEQLDQARSRAASSAAAVEQARARLAQAQQNLDWATVRSPVNGYVTHLLLDEGDYAAQGRQMLTLVDAESFRITAYFEETKLPEIKIGDAADIRLMAGDRKLSGHVSSIARGIAVSNNAPGEQNLANVNPTFQWVRLAQRVPVTIALDDRPRDLALTAGMSATVHIRPGRTAAHATIDDDNDLKLAPASTLDSTGRWGSVSGVFSDVREAIDTAQRGEQRHPGADHGEGADAAEYHGTDRAE